MVQKHAEIMFKYAPCSGWLVKSKLVLASAEADIVGISASSSSVTSFSPV